MKGDVFLVTLLLVAHAIPAAAEDGKAKQGAVADSPGQAVTSGPPAAPAVISNPQTPIDVTKPSHAPSTRTGWRRRANMEPTDTRIKGDGIKLPKCATESRESIECAK
jgi:hypothetical protein